MKAQSIQKRYDKNPWLKTNKCAIIIVKKGVGAMNLLKYALKKERWDLAAHVIVLAALKTLNQGVKPDGRKAKTKKGRAKR
jgi:hypothetical protein